MTDPWRALNPHRVSARTTRRHRAPSRIVRSFPFRPRFDCMEDRTLLSTFLVSNTGDSGSGSLRQAIIDSNDTTGAANTIDFTIPGSGVQTIAPVSPLPAITEPVLIDGWSGPGYAGTPLIDIDGTQAGGGDGLTITGSEVTVRGLDIGDFSQGAGIHLSGPGATGDWIYGNFLGTDPTGTQAEPNDEGVEIDNGASNNLIGTNGDGVNDEAERNLISGNLFVGVGINGQGTDGNAVAGNWIGTSVTGDVALENGTSPVTDNYDNTIGGGVVIDGGASDNLIGTDGNSVDDAGQRNIIAGSANDGIDIIGAGTDGNSVAGNLIGTDVTGSIALGIAGDGVDIAEGASSNWIGVGPTGDTTASDEGNVISGTGFDGVQIFGSNGNVVAGDKIGTDLTGTIALGNASDGVDINDGSGNTIGGTTAGAADVISGNGTSQNGYYDSGVELDFSSNNVVEGDFIGTDATGTLALGNAQDGVDIFISSGNTIGGTGAGAANIISGNGGSGVELVDSSKNLVQGDWIGTDVTGSTALGNAQAGVDLDEAPTLGQYDAPSTDNTIGGMSAIAANVISDNSGPGVAVTTSVANSSGLLLGDDEPSIAGAWPIGNQITANRIFGNTGQAIELGDGGLIANGASPRGGPNDLQNYPILFTSADGQTDGWLGGSEPDSTYRIDVFASAGYGPNGAGEAEDDLGSLEVTTNAAGQAAFAIPFSALPGLPVITATATDPQGNTSEVSALRQGSLEVPSQALRLAPGQPAAFTAVSGKVIALEDPEAGPLNLPWELTLSVAAGSVTLATTAGLTGTGNGSGLLAYSGTTSAIDAALAGMTYTPPPGYQGSPTLSLAAQSSGAAPIWEHVSIVVTNGQFAVTTTLDSGPGSLRQAILDSNLAIGGTNTIDFAIAGTGTQTITVASPLPAITNPVIIDGETEPGYAGAPLVAIAGPAADETASFAVSSDATVEGVALGGASFSAAASATMLTIESAPLSEGQNPVVTYQITVATGENMVATAQAGTGTTALSLLDAQGRLVVQSNGLSTTEPMDAIDTYIGPGTYSLQVHDLDGAGNFALTVLMTPSAAPLQPVPDGIVTSGDSPGNAVAIVAGDFNGDGKLDLAVAEQGSDSVAILLGNGDGTFQPAVDYTVGNGPDSIVAGDFTGDGRLDLAVACLGDSVVSILMGNGDGTFQTAVNYWVGEAPLAIAAGDFSRNGTLDLAVANGQSSDVSILMGNGDGTFQRAVEYPVGSSPDAIVAGNFSGDGMLDLAVANSLSNDVSILMGNGDGTFRSAGVYAVGSNPDAIVARDFSGGGKLDLAVVNSLSNNVSILMGNGDGTFQPAVNYAVGTEPTSIVAGDFNGDSRLDLAVGYIGGFAILVGSGSGNFQPAINYALESPSNALVAGDFNGDGRLDLACASFVPATISVLLGNGDGSFQSAIQTSVGNSGNDQIVAADFNGDGRLDLAVLNDDNDSVGILLGNGDGTFQPAVEYSVGIGADAIVADDFNRDGRLDLAIVCDANGVGTVDILLGNGDGTFQPAVDYSVGTGPEAIASGDFSGDGIIDLAVANEGSNNVSILMGNGDGTFQSAVNYSVGDAPDAIVAGDFNGDGTLDLAVANLLSNNVSILLGTGAGTFLPAVNYAVGTNPVAIVAADFRGDDGGLDLAVANQNSNNVSILLGSGDGTFQPAVNYAVGGDPLYIGTGPEAIAAGDFTADGQLDLAVGSLAFPGFAVLIGNGDGTFQPARFPSASQAITGAIVTGDFNGGGQVELAGLTAGAGTVSILLGTDGTFSTSQLFSTKPQTNPLVADVNGDGTDDVLVVDGGGNILYRQGIPGEPGTFEPPIIVNPGAPSRDIAWVPDTALGPLLASVDAHDDAVTLYAWRGGAFVPVGSLSTGPLPAQIIAEDLNGDGRDDLVVRNAGDGSLSVFFATGISGPVVPSTSLVPFFSPAILAAGLGVSDVQAIATTRSGRLDLVVTNALSGQLSVLVNLGNDTFGAPVPYRAGTGLSAVDPASTTEVTSLDATAGVAAGTLTLGGPTDLVTINPGSNTIDVLDNLGDGRFANPVLIDTQSPARIVRMGDFTGNGLDDLAVLTADAVSIYLTNGQGGFLPPTTYAVPSEADGLTLADLTGNGKLDLLVGDAYGDVLVLLGNGDGTFAPYHEANQAVELAVADLTGNGSKDIIYADQGLDRVVVDYGTGNSSILANQSTGLLDPGAVALADLNGDGIPDLIVANSGSNNVLIYPGLGNGQFGPAINDGNGYFVGTNPVGITVAELTGALPDLVVADEGSNQVSILLNQSQKGGAIAFSAGPRLDSGGLGPASTVVGNFTGGKFPDLLVTNSQSNDVTLLPGVGQGFFNDTDPRTYSVGTDPGPTFVGNFNGQTDLVTVNAGSNNLTLISAFSGPDPVSTSVTSAGLDPATAFEFSSDTGFDDLVVGNGGDGVLALFEGSSEGLTLSSSETVSDLPSPTSLAFASLSGGQVQFYAATEGQEAAALVALSLGGGPIAVLSAPASPISSGVAQLVPLQESSLALVGTLLTMTIESSTGGLTNASEIGAISALALSSAVSASGELTNASEIGAISALALSSAAPASLGQPVFARAGLSGLESDGNEEQAVIPENPAATPGAPSGAAWQRYTLGTDEAIERFDREHPELSPGTNIEPSATNPGEAPNEAELAPQERGDPGQSWVSTVIQGLRGKAADTVIDRLCSPDRPATGRSWWREDPTLCARLAFAATDPIATAQATCSALVRSLALNYHTPGRINQDAAVRFSSHRFSEAGWARSRRNAQAPIATSASLVLASVVAGYVYFGPASRRGGSSDRWSSGTRRWQRV